MEYGNKLKYSSIAISGAPGGGRSTLLKNLKIYLEPFNFEFWSGGEWARQFAINSGKHNSSDITHHNAEDYSDEIDRQIDDGMRAKLTDPNKRFVVESWIAGWNMRSLKHVLKVLLMCPDDLRVDRIVNRDNLTIEEAKEHLFDREKVNFNKWQRMYGVSDFWDPKHYDLVINTYSNGPKETVKLVLQALGYFEK